MVASASPSGFVVVANAAAGSSERDVVTQVAGRLAEVAPTSLGWSEDEASFDALTADVGDRRLVVVGGDGTFHFALNRLHATGRLDAPIGVIPAGTGNDFARGIGLDPEPTAACEALVDGVPRWYAGIEVHDGELAHNNAHVGLGLVAAERGKQWKPWLGRLAYSAAAVVEGVGYPGLALAVEVDGSTAYEGPALAVLVLLGPSMGGGLQPLDGVDVDEPVLDVVVVGVPSTAGRAGMALSAVRERLADRSDVGRWSARTATLRALDAADDGGAVRGDLDGEIREWPVSVTFTVRPRTWQVISPSR